MYMSDDLVFNVTMGASAVVCVSFLTYQLYTACTKRTITGLGWPVRYNVSMDENPGPFWTGVSLYGFLLLVLVYCLTSLALDYIRWVIEILKYFLTQKKDSCFQKSFLI